MIPPYSPAQLQGNLAPNFPSTIKEVKRWTFFDDLAIAAAASPLTGDNAFFQTPQGSGAKTRWNTNFHGQGGQLPAGQWFTVLEIGVEARTDLILSDTTTTILSNAILCVRNAIDLGILTIITGGSKFEIDGVPLLKFGAGGGFTSAGYGGPNITAGAAAGGGAVIVNNGVPHESAMYDLQSMPVVMAPGQNTQVIISYDATGVVIPANTTLRLKVFLDGYLYRPG